MIKPFVKNTANLLGLDIRLIRNVQNAQKESWEQKQDAMWRPFLAHKDIRIIIDVGASIGQFAKLIHRQCPNAKIISFEPLGSCQSELDAVLREIPGSRVVNAAVGDQSGTAKMNSSEFSPCSSLLPGTELLGEDYAGAAVTETVEVPVVTIDNALADENLQDEIPVKFDVQGFEIPAMKGAKRLLQKTSIVVCEVCFFRKLYEGQPLFHQIYDELRQFGFTYMGNAEQHRRKTDGRIVEADAIFERLG